MDLAEVVNEVPTSLLSESFFGLDVCTVSVCAHQPCAMTKRMCPKACTRCYRLNFSECFPSCSLHQRHMAQCPTSEGDQTISNPNCNCELLLCLHHLRDHTRKFHQTKPMGECAAIWPNESQGFLVLAWPMLFKTSSSIGPSAAASSLATEAIVDEALCEVTP